MKKPPKLDLGKVNSNAVVGLRIDADVPITSDGVVTDDTRLCEALETINTLQARGIRVVIFGHRGRPSGFDSTKTLLPVAERLGELLSLQGPTYFARDHTSRCEMLRTMKPGEVLLCENTRFDPREQSKQPTEREAYARELAEGIDLVIFEAIGVSHRKEASCYELLQVLPSFAGLNFAKEMEHLAALIEEVNDGGAVAFFAGRKTDKLKQILLLIEGGKIESFIVCGYLAWLLLRKQEKLITHLVFTSEELELADKVLNAVDKSGVKLFLPCDGFAATEFSPNVTAELFEIDGERTDYIDYEFADVGPKTMKHVCDKLSNANIVLLNGTPGAFDLVKSDGTGPFQWGTNELAQILDRKVTGKVYIGGGDTGAAMSKFGYKLDESRGHQFSAGGAIMEALAKGTLPALEVLS